MRTSEKSHDLIMEKLNGEPMRLSEVAEATKLNKTYAGENLARLQQKGYIRSICPLDNSTRFSGASIYYLPKDEDFAWIKYEKAHSIDTQRALERENAILRIAAEKKLTVMKDYNELRVIKNDLRPLIERGILRELYLTYLPKCWKGPYLATSFYYLDGFEKQVAAKVKEWVPKNFSKMGRRDKRRLTLMLEEMPFSLESKIRPLIGLSESERPLCKIKMPARMRKRIMKRRGYHQA